MFTDSTAKSGDESRIIPTGSTGNMGLFNGELEMTDRWIILENTRNFTLQKQCLENNHYECNRFLDICNCPCHGENLK